MNNLNIIKNLIDTHIEKVHDFIFETSDIIKIMDFIVDEINNLDREIKTIVDSFDDDLFYIFEITNSLDKIKELESSILELSLSKLEDINMYLDKLAEKRIINNLDKISLLSFTNLLMNITYTNCYTNYMLKRIDDYKEKTYRKR